MSTSNLPADEFAAESLLCSENLGFVEQQYHLYLGDPLSVEKSWRDYFADWNGQNGESSNGNGRPARQYSRSVTGPSFTPRSIYNPAGVAGPGLSAGKQSAPAGPELMQDRVYQVVRNFRVRGHIIANVDPLGKPTPDVPELDPATFGFQESDWDREFSASDIQGPEVQTLRQIVDRMRNTYCRSIGVQYMHIDDLGIREWLQQRMEGCENRISLSRNVQRRILTRLTDAVVFEEFIQKKFIGAKSFSLEGAESLIPLLDLAIEKAGDEGAEHVVLGMAHRGRLNVLSNIMGKNARRIFREFEDKDPELHFGRGDVKYHLGYSGDWETQSGNRVHLSLCFNPSHLEYVNPVAVGRMRAKLDRLGDEQHERGLVILIHGDSAFAGEGIVQETLNMSELPAYTVGGTIHVIVNNQLGFTTGPEQGRSTAYATSVAKMLASPIFHVNGEDPEAVAQVINLALDFRTAFHRDVVIDMYCFRKLGHNEGDEPAFTQPLMYQSIAKHPTIRESYRDHLLKLDGLTLEEAERIAEERQDHLTDELEVARRDDFAHVDDTGGGVWAGYSGGPEEYASDPDTGLPEEELGEMMEQLTKLPQRFTPHTKIRRLLEQRREMARNDRPLDWSAGEALAFASLLKEGSHLRMTGQDSERGTFSQRHAMLHDSRTGEKFMPLWNLKPDHVRLEIANSPLCESGVLGFEYGYSLDCPDGLVIWEAQFGDFANAAQVIIDQFIASAEDKWRRLSGLVLLLPHGFEGQGPEHSSARLERFLALCAEDNMIVCQPTTPAQYFHMLRRQVVRPWRKPLVVMTPKSLLRHKDAVSSLADCATGRFQRVIPDDTVNPQEVTRVLLCSGKVYYDLLGEREALERNDVAIVRLEQFYPFPWQELQAAMSQYNAETPVIWVQEEPSNMGAWRFLCSSLGNTLFDDHGLSGICRPASASPATGSASSHRLEQSHLLEQAFNDNPHEPVMAVTREVHVEAKR